MARMHVKPSATGTRAHTLESVWCRRVSRKGPTVDQSRILLGTLRDMLRGDDGRIVRETVEVAPGVRRRAGVR